MLYIKEISENHKKAKVIYSIEREDIEFIWDIKTIKKAIENGHQYKTVFVKNGKLVEGNNVIIHNNFLTTEKNEKIEDNLNELSRF